VQIQSITLSTQDSVRELRERQLDAHQIGTQALQTYQRHQTYLEKRITEIDTSLTDMRVEQRQNIAAFQENFVRSIQPLLSQTEQMMMTIQQSAHRRQTSQESSPELREYPDPRKNSSSVQVSATITMNQCPRGCRCRCHTRSSLQTPSALRGLFGQLQWSYKSSLSIRSCNHSECRKSISNQHMTYYFPRWLVSRAFVASANLDNIFGAGAKVMVNIPLIVPEEEHIVWSLVIAGNVEELKHVLARDKNLMYVKNQWGQSIMHVSPKFVIQNLWYLTSFI
jgi:hypothetical protein